MLTNVVYTSVISNHRDPWKFSYNTTEKIKMGSCQGLLFFQVSKECGSSRRPPYSYMLLIQMALNSREDRKMTLREICKWIEDKFPFYKHASKPGWKVSARTDDKTL